MVIRMLVAITLILLFVFSYVSCNNSTPSISSTIAYAAASTENGQVLFEQKCKACHTIGGGRAVGPDLKGITVSQDRDWLVRFIVAPDKLVAQGDVKAKELVQEYSMVMPNLGVSEEDAKAVLTYIESQSGNLSTATPPAQSGTQKVSLSQVDANAGKSIFVGTTSLKNGGPACISCHNVSGIGLIGGGTVGKDLTGIYPGMGEIGLTSVLKTYPFPLMKEIYTAKPITDEEIGNLLAFLKEANAAKESSLTKPPIFLMASAAGALLVMGIFQFLWRGRLAGVRRPLVKGGSK